MSPLQIPTRPVSYTRKPQVSGLPYHQTPTHPPNSGQKRFMVSTTLRRRGESPYEPAQRRAVSWRIILDRTAGLKQAAATARWV